MENQISCLTQACDKLALSYCFVDTEKNLLQVNFPWGKEYFQINKTPFNREVIMGLFRDKMHSYELLHNCVNMPTTVSFLDFNVPPEYQHYCRYHSIPDMVNIVRQTFDFPLVVKCNSGALGIGVHLCQDEQQATDAFGSIFNHNSKNYDYLALAQSYIPTKTEYRLVCAFGEPLLAYQRGNATGFNARYWDRNEIATHVTDPLLIEQLHAFIKPVFEQVTIGFVGFDIILGKDDNFYLIELNSSPKFNHFIKNNDDKHVVEMYIKVLQLFIERRN